MNDIRAKFEEIWPVPEGVYWCDGYGDYEIEASVPRELQQVAADMASEWDARLDTFTRCQETTALYVGIVDELIGEMELVLKCSNDLGVIGIARESIGRAKQKLEEIK